MNFKRKIKCVNENDWNVIFELKFKYRPMIGELIYHEDKYYDIINIIHQKSTIIVIVNEKIQNEKNKNNT